jgi:hypothetical protein
MESESRNVPCRLFVILAQEAPTGVIFRRGPSKWVQIIKWNTDTDIFEFGQWFHGRIYEYDCDLSPDGTKLVYFALNYAKDIPGWTGVSKIPYLTALAFIAHGYALGGGLFLSNNEVRLKVGMDAIRGDRCPPELKITASWTPADVLAYRLRFKGWHEKPHPFQPLSLFSNLSHTLQNNRFIVKDNKRNLEIPLEGAIWADWDKRGRLVYAKEGKLFTGEINNLNQIQSTEIADFNANKPERIITPEWAKVW